MHLGPRTFVVHNNSCRVERVEVCRRLSLSKSLESTVRAFAFYIPGEYTQSTKYIYSIALTIASSVAMLEQVRHVTLRLVSTRVKLRQDWISRDVVSCRAKWNFGLKLGFCVCACPCMIKFTVLINMRAVLKSKLCAVYSEPLYTFTFYLYNTVE